MMRNPHDGAGGNPFESLSGRFGTILIDPPWPFKNRTGKVAPEHWRLHRYATMTMERIRTLPVHDLGMEQSHLYLWTPSALLEEALEAMKAWGWVYKTDIVWFKVRKDGGPDGRGVGFYFRGVTEHLLFGTRGGLRTGKAGRTQTNIIVEPKREHSRKPEGQYGIIEACSPGPYLELFARGPARQGWTTWGDQTEAS
jgi:N6-adenosine-specific RNA methylase IME4